MASWCAVQESPYLTLAERRTSTPNFLVRQGENNFRLRQVFETVVFSTSLVARLIRPGGAWASHPAPPYRFEHYFCFHKPLTAPEAAIVPLLT